MLDKLLLKVSVLQRDLKAKGLKESITARILKHSLTHFVYKLFLPKSVQSQGLTFYIDKNDTVISRTLMKNKLWEPVETQVFMNNIKSGDVVLDIGAQIGYYTLLASKLVGPKGKVYAFEPDPRVFDILKKNIQVNQAKNVTPVQKAVSDVNGSFYLYTNPDTPSDNQIFSGDSKKIQRTKVQTVSIDSFIKDKKVDFVKIDIQGAEFLALSGMKKMLSKYKPIIVLEFWPKGLTMSGSSYKDVLSLLSKRRYILWNIDEYTKRVMKTNEQKLKKMVETGALYDTNLLCVSQ